MTAPEHGTDGRRALEERRHRALQRQVGGAARLCALPRQRAARTATPAPARERDRTRRSTRTSSSCTTSPILSLQSQHVDELRGAAALAPSRARIDRRRPTFLPLAERTGAILDIGRWVLEQACRDAKRWADERQGHGQPVAAAAREPATCRRSCASALAEPGSSHAARARSRRESLLDRNAAGAARDARASCASSASASRSTISARRAARSSNLQAYPFDKIKIDRALVQGRAGAGRQRGDRQGGGDARAHARHRSVAEGVETRDELNMVARAGCNKVQGYYFSRPVPAAELEAVLSECPRSSCAVAA